MNKFKVCFTFKIALFYLLKNVKLIGELIQKNLFALEVMKMELFVQVILVDL